MASFAGYSAPRVHQEFVIAILPRTGLDREERLTVIVQVAQMNSYPLGTHLKAIVISDEKAYTKFSDCSVSAGQF